MKMAQEVQGKIRSFSAGAALLEHRLVRMDGSTAETVNYPAATAGNFVVGATCERPIASGEKGPIRMFNAGGTVRLTAAGAITANAVVYVSGAAGKIDDTANGAAIGIALKAATADGDVIEVMVFKPVPNAPLYSVGGVAAGYAIARGQQTTVAASDTVVTGLATVVSVVAALDSDPVDDPFMCSSSIGDQAGAPAAGSVYIKTWKNTAGTDPTPAAATTFSKKVNWIAVGTL
jgi:hypothetical protein